MNDVQKPFFYAHTQQAKPAVMVSSCLLGEKVRYDGKDQHLPLISLLQGELQLIGCCPEVGAGFSVPRPPIQLVKIDNDLIARGRDNHQLIATKALVDFSQHSLSNSHPQLCGYLLKSRSPSCGLNSTPLFDNNGEEIGRDGGLQATYFQQHKPWLIFAEETTLTTEQACQQFIYQCRVLWEAQQCQKSEQDKFLAHYGLQRDKREDFLQRMKNYLVEQKE